MSVLQSEVMFGLTWLHLLGGVAGVIIVLRIVDALRTKDEGEEYFETLRCGCGWQGKASKFARRCPKCNADLVA